ncbi:hypothetical protein F7725_022777 [Dissostichus mawsoni]|uniref:Uncharacterized protein n=1 Tax=Dissostichus mawsoni TaxID=36200 RepID=A0A7J5YYR7_DISMA|nr:hypothetical protein F7725_022777 [Dissostichus mawsoni]
MLRRLPFLKSIFLGKFGGLWLVYGTRIVDAHCESTSLVRASTDSLTCGLLQVGCARSSATLSNSSETQKASNECLIDTKIVDIPFATPHPAVPEPLVSPIDIPPITATIDADEASDILVTEVCQNGVVESVEELMEVEAADNLEQLASDFNEESVSGLLKNLELKGNDLVADLIPNDVNIPGDMTISTELM